MLLKEMGINPQERFLLHVGTEHPRKNRNFLLDIFTFDTTRKLCA